MRFNSYTFLAFIVIYLLFYFLSRKQNSLFKTGSLIFSYVFYSWTYPPYIFLLLISTIIDFYCGLKIENASERKRRKFFLIISLITNLGLLGYFKYFNFFLDSFTGIFGGEYRHMAIILPVGISFYTFQSMSYTIDVYRRKIKHEKSLLDFALYVAFFPQLVAGPIVFARDFLGQVKQSPRFRVNDLYRGLMLILYGYFLKSVIADNLAVGVDVFFMNPGHFNAWEALYYCYCYSFQIFGDFAGYSYIAIGIAKILGYNFPKNFDYPYLATSITDFWHRWHISLSTWLKEYLYFSLGGNRKGTIKTYRNLIITMLLGGLWHGACWNFVIWGGIHGLMLAIEKWLMSKFPEFFKKRNPLLLFFRWFLTFHLVLVAWIFFRTSTLPQAFEVMEVFTKVNVGEAFSLQSKISFLLIVLIYIVSIYREQCYNLIFKYKWLYALVAFVLFYLWLTMGKNSNAFIYFQF